MIKLATLGMYEIAKNNPVLTSESDVTLYDFITEDGVTYLVANTLTGDEAYQDGIVIKAGEYLNGFDLSAWVDQELVIDEKHIAFDEGKSYDDITAGTTLLKIGTDGLEVAESAPSSGFYFKVTDKCRLTEKAVKVKILAA